MGLIVDIINIIGKVLVIVGKAYLWLIYHILMHHVGGRIVFALFVLSFIPVIDGVIINEGLKAIAIGGILLVIILYWIYIGHIRRKVEDFLDI